jgi:hypothetical protein
VASDTRAVPAGPKVAPEARAAASCVVEDAAAVGVGAPFQALGSAPQDRSEGAGQLTLEPLARRAAHRGEVDEIAAGRVALKRRANGQPANDLVQLGELAPGERAAGGDGVCETVEQAAELVERLAFVPVIQEAEKCLVRVERNALLCQRPLHDSLSSLLQLSP